MKIILGNTENGREYSLQQGLWYAVAAQTETEARTTTTVNLIINKLCHIRGAFVIKISVCVYDGLIRYMHECKKNQITFMCESDQYIVVLNTTGKRLCEALEKIGYKIRI